MRICVLWACNWIHDIIRQTHVKGWEAVAIYISQIVTWIYTGCSIWNICKIHSKDIVLKSVTKWLLTLQYHQKTRLWCQWRYNINSNLMLFKHFIVQWVTTYFAGITIWRMLCKWYKKKETKSGKNTFFRQRMPWTADNDGQCVRIRWISTCNIQ